MRACHWKCDLENISKVYLACREGERTVCREGRDMFNKCLTMLFQNVHLITSEILYDIGKL